MKAVVLVSGGLDSTTLLYHVVHQDYQVEAISLIYGQKHVKEVDFAKYHCQKLGVLFNLVDLTGIAQFLSSSSLVGNAPIPDVKEVLGDPQPSTYVPNRNMMFLSIAAAYAENIEATKVFYGAQRHDLYCLDTKSWVIDKDLGPIQLLDIKNNQTIVDIDGNFTTVLEIGKEIVPVHAEIRTCGAMYKCSLGHEVPVVDYKVHKWARTWEDHKIKWIPARYVEPGMFTIMPLKRTQTFESTLNPILELQLWWVTEGCSGNGHIDIAQSVERNPENYSRICSLIEMAGYKPWKSRDRISFSYKAQHLFEDLGTNSYTKRLPKEVFSLSKDESLVALDILVQGDGSKNERGSYYYTTSEQLAQDIIALSLQAGIPAKPQRRVDRSIDIHIPPAETIKKRPRSFQGYQSVKIDSIEFLSEDLEVAKLKTSTGTYLGGNIGFLGQSNGYWDVTPEFLDRTNHVLQLNRKNTIQIEAPFVEFKKSDIIKLGLELGVDYSKTWSCYSGNDKPSRRSATSAERIKAFQELGLEDPLEYAD